MVCAELAQGWANTRRFFNIYWMNEWLLFVNSNHIFILFVENYFQNITFFIQMKNNSLLSIATWVWRKEIKKTGTRKIFFITHPWGNIGTLLTFLSLQGNIYISFSCLPPCSSTNNGVCVNHFLFGGLLNHCIINIFINKKITPAQLLYVYISRRNPNNSSFLKYF